MKIFKPGDILLWRNNNEEAYLVLEVDSEKELCMVYTLNSSRKKFVGKKLNLWFYKSEIFTLLQDIKIK